MVLVVACNILIVVCTVLVGGYAGWKTGECILFYCCNSSE